jgi:HAD superfamily hydrolase (TIGR01549 family)
VTSPPVDEPEALRRILARAEALFLDFDGPVCDVFAGLPAAVVVDQLCVVLADGGYGDPPPEVEKSSDPFDVLKYAATLGETEARYVNAAFTALEVEAIVTARPTAGAHDLVRAWSQTSRPIAIVSNNSTVAIEAYLERHRIRTLVTTIAARTTADVAELKPNSYLLNEALRTLGLTSNGPVFVGDSVTDMMAARTVGMTSVGYANKPGKVDQLMSDDVALIITTMIGLLSAVT